MGAEGAEKRNELGAEALVPTLAQLAAGTATATAQPEDGVTYAAKLERDEGVLDFSRPAVELERQIRAFTPWPGAFTEHDGTRIKVLAAEVLALGSLANAPGTVLDTELTIACGTDALRPTRVQRPGKGPMSNGDFLRGFPLAPGTILGRPETGAPNSGDAAD